MSISMVSSISRTISGLCRAAIIAGILWAPGIHAQSEESENAPTTQNATPDSYQLRIRDQLDLTVYDEPDLSTSQRIDGRGLIRVPLLGNARVAGLTIRQAEEYLQRAYVEERLLRDPMVTIQVTDYASREVSVLGAVASPGVLTFPIEANSLHIVDVISEMGGFEGIAKSDKVRVTRRTPNGQTVEFTVNVERMITGRGDDAGERSRARILPGDVIWVPERLF